MKNGETLACAVIFRAVNDYRKQVFSLSRFYKMWHDKIEKGENPYLWKYNEMVAELAHLRRFFTEENIYWSYTDLDGETLLNEIERRMKK